MSTFMRTASASSLSSIGSDHSEVAGKSGKVAQDPVKGRNMLQRTRDALGDIGNRLKKNPTQPGVKVGLKKETTTTTKAATRFAVPAQRPPRAKAVIAGKPKPTLKPTVKKETDVVDATAGVPKVVVKLEANVKSGNCEQIVSSKHNEENKENASEKSVTVVDKEQPDKQKEASQAEEVNAEAEVENEFNPKLSSENVVAVTETFTSDRMNIANIDVDEWNPLLVQVYITEIYDYVFNLEQKYPVRIRYLDGRHINSRMRGVLLDWLVEVHLQFGFMPETLYMCTKILDRYLQAERNVTRKQLQLVGATAMYLAAKYEEVCTPAVQDFAAVSDNAFTVSDVIKMERDMLQTLDFDLAFPPSVLFLRRFSKSANANMAIHSMAKYIMELSLVDYAGCHLFPSQQAAGSLALALLILENKSLTEVWTPTIQFYSRCNLEDIKPHISLLAGIVARAQDETHKLKAVNKKYTGKRLNCTSIAPELKLEAWKQRVLTQVCKL